MSLRSPFPLWLFVLTVAALMLVSLQSEAAPQRGRDLTAKPTRSAANPRLTTAAAVGGSGGSGGLTAWGSNSLGQTTVPPGMWTVKSVAAGGGHSLALGVNGLVSGWGENGAGQAAPPAGLSMVKAIAAGGSHSLALRANGTVAGWGSNTAGQAAPPVGLDRVMEIAAGGSHSLALLANGTLVGWGSDADGQVSGAAGQSEGIAIAAGGGHCLVLRADGSVVAWGRNTDGQCDVPGGLQYVRAIAAGGSHSLAVRNDGTVVAWGSNSDGQVEVPAGLEKVIAVCAGDAFSLALRSNGTAVAWGRSTEGQTAIPSALENVVTLAAGSAHVLAASSDSWVSAWGSGSLSVNSMRHVKGIAGGGLQVVALQADGRVSYSGVSSGFPSSQPWTPPSWLEGVVGVQAGTNVGMAALDSGAIAVWGYTGWGQTTVPERTPGYRSVMDAGERHCVALCADGTVVEWGAIANGNPRNPPPPLPVVRGVAAGGTSSYGLLANGVVREWYNGSLGDPTIGSDMIAIAAGDQHLIALRADGTVFGWGNNNSGQIITEGLTNVVAIAAGDDHSVALRADGSVVAWGSNSSGQRNVTAAPTATGVAGSSSFSFAILAGARPSVAPIPAQETFEDFASDTIPVTISDPDGISFDLSAVAMPSNRVKNITFGGLGHNRTIQVVPADHANGTVQITLTVSDGRMSASTGFPLVIRALNDRPTFTIGSNITVDEDSGPFVAPNWATNRSSGPPDEAGQTLSFQVKTNSNPGLFTVGPAVDAATGRLTFTPAPNASGSASVGLELVDNGGRDNGGQDTSVRQTFTVTVSNDNNDPPQAGDLSLSTPEDTALTVPLAGSDPDGGTPTYQVVASPAHGTLSGSGASRTYTPAANFHGPDSFTYRASDGTLTSTAATVTLTVTPVNDPPTAQAQTVNTQEDKLTPITLAGTDIDGDPLTYVVVTQPTRGTLSGTGAERSYQPDLNSTSNDSFTFRVSDGVVTSSTATVTINVTPVNDAPVAFAQNLTTREETSLPIILGATDVESFFGLAFFIMTGPAHGILTGSGEMRTYVPAPGYAGSDSFTFYASDGLRNSDPVTISITVTPVNDAPVVRDFPLATAEDTPVTVTFQGTDVEGDPLTFFIVAGPQHGTVSGSGAERTYTPAADYSGTDFITYFASDGMNDSQPGVISLTISPRNDAPTAQEQSLQTAEETTLFLTLSGSDPEGDSLSFQVVAHPTNGILSGTGANRTYLPFPEFRGTDSFTFQVSDGSATSATATVTIDVTGSNDPPTARSQGVTLLEDAAAAVTLEGTDPDGDSLTYFILSSPAHGTLSGSGANRTYTPAPDYHGPDSFTFRVFDGTADSTTATVSLTVIARNDAPTARAQAVATPEDTPLAIALGSTDPDGDSLTFGIVSLPARGTLSGSGANRTYTPDPNYHGPDSFSFRVSDAAADSAPATVSITVQPRSDAPVANPQTRTTSEDTALLLTLTATDGDGDSLTYEIVTGPAHGTLSGSGASRTYTPAANYHGPDSFTFRASDATGDSAPATVSLTVTPRNDLPVATAQSRTTPEDTALSLTLVATDADGDSLAYQILSAPTHGTLSGSGANRTYTPDANYHGSDSFTFQVSDASGDSAPAAVSITVSPRNDAPVANAQNRTTPEDTALALTLAGTDTEGDSLTFEVVSGPSHGTLTGAGANRTYTPAAHYHGADSFTFRVSDGTAASAEATVTLTVTPVADAPVAVADGPYTVQRDTAFSLTPPGLLANDTDGDGDALTAELVTAPTRGGVVLVANGAFTYTPRVGSTGSDSFTYRVSDGTTTSAPVTVTLTIGSQYPPSTAGWKASGTGKVTIDGKAAGIKLAVTVSAKGRASGSASLTIPRGATYKSTSIAAVVVTGTRARIHGKAAGPNRSTVDFVIEVEDGGAVPSSDRFRLDASDGFSTGTLPLTTGNLAITRK